MCVYILETMYTHVRAILVHLCKPPVYIRICIHTRTHSSCESHYRTYMQAPFIHTYMHTYTHTKLTVYARAISRKCMQAAYIYENIHTYIYTNTQNLRRCEPFSSIYASRLYIRIHTYIHTKNAQLTQMRAILPRLCRLPIHTYTCTYIHTYKTQDLRRCEPFSHVSAGRDQGDE